MITYEHILCLNHYRSSEIIFGTINACYTKYKNGEDLCQMSEFLISVPWDATDIPIWNYVAAFMAHWKSASEIQVFIGEQYGVTSVVHTLCLIQIIARKQTFVYNVCRYYWVFQLTGRDTLAPNRDALYLTSNKEITVSIPLIFLTTPSIWNIWQVFLLSFVFFHCIFSLLHSFYIIIIIVFHRIIFHSLK